MPVGRPPSAAAASAVRTSLNPHPESRSVTPSHLGVALIFQNFQMGTCLLGAESNKTTWGTISGT